MLIIRNEQMAALRQAMIGPFAERMLRVLRAEAPEVTETATDAELHELVNYGIERARAHQLTGLQTVERYVLLMAFAGRDFDRDPKHPRVGELFEQQPDATPAERFADVEDYVLTEWERA